MIEREASKGFLGLSGMPSRKILLTATSIVSLVAISDGAQARDLLADSSNSVVDTNDIIVTAQRRAEPLQRTPVAVGILGAEIIERRNVTQVRDLAGTVPGLFLPKTNSAQVQQIYIRGIGTSSPIYNGAVAIYIDDIYTPRTLNGAIFGSPDLERVEVLRGPQGTLYGQSSSGGAIKIISKDPSNEFKAWVSGSLGNYESLEGKLYLTGPLIPDKLTFSVALSHQENEGYVKNLFLGENVNGVLTNQARVKLKFTPTERLTFVLSGGVVLDKSDNAVGTPSRFNGMTPAPRTTFEDRRLSQNFKQYSATLHADLELSDELRIRSITGFRTFTNKPSTWSNDGVPGDITGFQLNAKDEHWSEEIQLMGDFDRFNFTLGAIGFREVFKQDRPTWANNVYTGTFGDTTVKSFAIYAQGRYEITESLGLTLGGRLNWQKDSFDWYRYRSDVNLGVVQIVDQVNGQIQKTNGFVPRIGLDHQFNPDLFGYVTFAKGEKAGGFNSVASVPVLATIPLAPEKVTAYEAGLKFALFDKRVRANIAGFYNSFSDYHATVQNPIVNGQQLTVPLITNAGKAETYGIEFDATARVGDRLTLRTAVTHLRTKFLRFLNPTGAASSDFTGNVLPRAPRWAASGGFSLDLPIPVAGTLRWSGDVEAVSTTYEDIPLTQRVQPYALLSSDLRYITANDHLTLSVSVRNILDKEFVITSQRVAATNSTTFTYNAPRTVLFTARYDF